MTAGAGILHIEQPTEQLVAQGGLLHGVQLWVNLPRTLKMTPPRYQDIDPDAVRLLSSHDGGALVRLIAGDLGDVSGPGRTWTPITYVHATLAAGARLDVAWPAEFNALVYVLNGQGSLGDERRPIEESDLALFAAGDRVVVDATTTLDVLVLGGRPLREPIFHYGPFVMNTRDEIVTAIEDFNKGHLGKIPAVER
jgi:hypothetical protein